MLKIYLHPGDDVFVGQGESEVRIIFKGIDRERNSITLLFDAPRDIPILRGVKKRRGQTPNSTSVVNPIDMTTTPHPAWIAEIAEAFEDHADDSN